MRKVFITMFAALAFAGIASAQEDSKAPVLTGEKFIDHTFVGVTAGVNTLFARESDIKDQVNKGSLDLDIYLGKWFTPAVGVRMGFQKMNVREQFPSNFFSHTVLQNVPEDGNLKFGGNYTHGDIMWSLINGIWGYKESRKFDVIPYGHVGWARLYDPSVKGAFIQGNKSESSYHDDEFAAGPGIMLTYKAAKRLSIVLDVKDVILSGRFHDYANAGIVNNLTAGLGLQLGIGATEWNRPKQVVDRSGELADALAALAAAKAALDKANADKDALAKALEDCQNSLPKDTEDVVYIKTNLGVTPITLYYDINSVVLNATELRHLDDYMNDILSKDPERVFYLTGSADSGTGTLEINQRLVKGRSEGVKKIMIEKYNVAEDHIILKEGKITDENSDPRFDRSTIIEH